MSRHDGQFRLTAAAAALDAASPVAARHRRQRPSRPGGRTATRVPAHPTSCSLLLSPAATRTSPPGWPAVPDAGEASCHRRGRHYLRRNFTLAMGHRRRGLPARCGRRQLACRTAPVFGCVSRRLGRGAGGRLPTAASDRLPSDRGLCPHSTGMTRRREVSRNPESAGPGVQATSVDVKPPPQQPAAAPGPGESRRPAQAARISADWSSLSVPDQECPLLCRKYSVTMVEPRWTAAAAPAGESVGCLASTTLAGGVPVHPIRPSGRPTTRVPAHSPPSCSLAALAQHYRQDGPVHEGPGPDAASAGVAAHHDYDRSRSDGGPGPSTGNRTDLQRRGRRRGLSARVGRQAPAVQHVFFSPKNFTFLAQKSFFRQNPSLFRDKRII